MAKRAGVVKEAVMTKDDPARAARMAEALRANLKRRKAQDREKAAAAVIPPVEPSDG